MTIHISSSYTIREQWFSFNAFLMFLFYKNRQSFGEMLSKHSLSLFTMKRWRTVLKLVQRFSSIYQSLSMMTIQVYFKKITTIKLNNLKRMKVISRRNLMKTYLEFIFGKHSWRLHSYFRWFSNSSDSNGWNPICVLS